MARGTNDDLRRYAVVGAEQRLIEIAEEAAQIFRVFPELRAPGRGLDAVGRQGREPDAAAQNPHKVRRRRTISAEGRKRISQAQKARWAKHNARGKN